jgi:hypothetical protein
VVHDRERRRSWLLPSVIGSAGTARRLYWLNGSRPMAPCSRNLTRIAQERALSLLCVIEDRLPAATASEAANCTATTKAPSMIGRAGSGGNSGGPQCTI